MNLEWDIFLSYAGEDRSFCQKLFSSLVNHGVKVWYDEDILKIGDSIRRTIDYGLAHSRYGIVVISKYFIKKEWTKKELDALFNREDECILPIWHGVREEEVRSFSPMLVDKYALKSDIRFEELIDNILKVLGTKDYPKSQQQKISTSKKDSSPKSYDILPEVPQKCECCGERDGTRIMESSPSGVGIVAVSLCPECQSEYWKWRIDPQTEFRYPEIKYKPDVKAFLAMNINYRTKKSISDRIDAAYKRLQFAHGDSYAGGIALSDLGDAHFEAAQYREALGRYEAAKGHLARTEQWDLHKHVCEQISKCKSKLT